jgi:two-component system CheB/CheR fusion protein
MSPIAAIAVVLDFVGIDIFLSLIASFCIFFVSTYVSTKKHFWIYASYVPPTLITFFAIRDVMTYGIGVTNIIQFIIALILTTLLFNIKFQGVILLISIVASATSGVLHTVRNESFTINDLIYWALIVNFAYIMISFSLNFLTRQFESTLNELEESNRLKEEAFNNMSHEIRTPMNAIIGLTDLLKETKLNATQKKYLDNVKLSADNILLIINDILDYSKANAGKIIFDNSVFDIKESILNSVESVKAEALKKNLKVTTHISKQIPEKVIGDSYRLNQILLNLLSNAIKFTRKGSIYVNVVQISKKPRDNNKVWLKIKVKDTGIGIEKNKQSQIFESYSQANTSITKEFGGTGLGLAIVKKIIEGQGGHICVQSKIGQGSTFTVQLPFEKVDNNSRNIGQKSSSKDASFRFKDLNILIAEDNKINQMVVSTILKKRGINVTSVENGIQVIEKLKRKNYDLVLMDIKMPKMDGLITTRYIRNKLKHNNDLPIIGLSAYISESDKEKSIKVGMDSYLTKPFRPSKLLSEIQHLLQAQKLPDQE